MSAEVTAVLGTALRRGAPDRRTVVRAVGVGALAQLMGVALVGGAAALLTWSSLRPGLSAVAGLLIAVELVAFLRAPVRHAGRLSAHGLGLDGLRGWRTWLLDSVSTWAPSRLAAARSGDLLARCLGDADALQDLWVRAVVPAASSILALVLASILLAIAFPVAGLAVLVATVLVCAVTWLGIPRVAALGVEESEVRGTIAARAAEFAHGASSFALLGAEAGHVEATLALVSRADGLAAKRRTISSMLGVGSTVAAAAALFAATAAVTLPTTNPSVDAGVVLAVLVCAELLAAIPASLEGLGPVVGAASRLEALEETVPHGTVDATSGTLRLFGVDVAATEGAHVLLHDVELSLAAGTSISVSGPSGSGKSALLAVAARLERARAGRVTLADVELDQLDEASLRREVAWLPTNPGLLEGRVRDVLDVGRGLSDASLVSSLQAVGLWDTLEARGGLEAVIGARGDDLSGGERRRLALSRLLAGAPSVLVLDEPTAGLDDAAASVVLGAVADSGASVLVATHDPRVSAWSGSSLVVREDGSLSR